MRIFIALGFCLLATGCATTYSGGTAPGPLPEARAFSVDKDVVFTPPDWTQALKADIYRPQGAGPFPTVLVVHGGGWITGKREEMSRISRRLAEQGFVAVEIDYRLAPEFVFPSPLQDLQQAMRWIHANAAHYAMDDQRIGAWGYSAGAELVSLLGTLSPGDPNFAEGTRVRAVVSGGTPADLRFAGDSTLVRKYIGHKIDDEPQLYRQASPVAFVSSDDPPMFLYHGGLDWVVGDVNARRMKDELDRVGVPAELLLVHGMGHIGVFTFGYGEDEGVAFLRRRLR